MLLAFQLKNRAHTYKKRFLEMYAIVFRDWNAKLMPYRTGDRFITTML